MLPVFVIGLSSAGMVVTAQEQARRVTIDAGVSVKIPAGYERIDNLEQSRAIYVKRGEWKSAAPWALLGEGYSGDLSDWFEDDVLAFVSISVERLTDERAIAASPALFHESFADSFTARWGKFSFSFFDNTVNAGRYVNFAGAAVFLAVRRERDLVISVEAMDLVEVLVAEAGESPPNSPETPIETRWQYFQKAANDEVVRMILKSIKIVQ